MTGQFKEGYDPRRTGRKTREQLKEEKIAELVKEKKMIEKEIESVKNREEIKMSLPTPKSNKGRKKVTLAKKQDIQEALFAGMTPSEWAKEVVAYIHDSKGRNKLDGLKLYAEYALPKPKDEEKQKPVNVVNVISDIGKSLQFKDTTPETIDIESEEETDDETEDS